MPVFSPRRYQPPYYPVHRDGAAMRAFTAMERSIKGVLFGCRMCGNCILQETAFVCPMTCPMGLRNGLCGGASPEHCAVDPSRPCTWYTIYARAEKMGRLDKLLEINAPLDGNRTGHETWLDMVQQWRKRDEGPRPVELITDRKKFKQEMDDLFHDLRQPDWWEGDAEYHPPAYEEPVSRLDAALRTGAFVVTAEIAPPLGASSKLIEKKAELLREVVVAANFTDNASASARMSSVACSKICLDLGLEPVMQLQARDRTRVALESEAMGAAGSPFGAPPKYEAIRAEKKINAGAQFIQTQPIFDVDGFTDWLEALDKRNLLDKVAILAGMVPLKSANAAHFMADGVPGVVIPPQIVARMDAAGDDKDAQQETGVTIALEIIDRLKALPGIRGLHIMAVHWEEIVPRLVAEGELRGARGAVVEMVGL